MNPHTFLYGFADSAAALKPLKLNAEIHLVEAGDDLPFPDVPDEGAVARRRPSNAVQVSFEKAHKPKGRSLICTTKEHVLMIQR